MIQKAPGFPPGAFPPPPKRASPAQSADLNFLGLDLFSLGDLDVQNAVFVTGLDIFSLNVFGQPEYESVSAQARQRLDEWLEQEGLDVAFERIVKR